MQHASSTICIACLHLATCLNVMPMHRIKHIYHDTICMSSAHSHSWDTQHCPKMAQNGLLVPKKLAQFNWLKNHQGSLSWLNLIWLKAQRGPFKWLNMTLAQKDHTGSLSWFKLMWLKALEGSSSASLQVLLCRCFSASASLQVSFCNIFSATTSLQVLVCISFSAGASL